MSQFARYLHINMQAFVQMVRIITLGVRAMGTRAREEDTIPIQGLLVAPSFVRKGSHEAKR